MIIKSFELNKINLKKNKFFLAYGDNQGAKDELIDLLINKKFENVYKYFENDIISNPENLYNTISSKSFFNNEKIIVIKKVTNKILKIFEVIFEKNYEDITVIFDADTLDKKSKLRAIFEKENNLICIPFYPDNNKTIEIIMSKFLNENKINLSRESINILIDRANGSREHLLTELQKIKNLSITRKRIELEDIMKLTNLGNEYKISELVDHCLAKNKVRVIKFINENNFRNEDAILIIRIFLSKAKRLLKLNKNLNGNKNLENVIYSFKPSIFWKEKEIVKTQMKIWSYDKIQDLINQINKIEILLKKTPELSIYILNNFIFKNVKKFNNSI